jgi:hypothetical protein
MEEEKALEDPRTEPARAPNHAGASRHRARALSPAPPRPTMAPRILFVSGFHPATRARDLAYEFEKCVPRRAYTRTRRC